MEFAFSVVLKLILTLLALVGTKTIISWAYKPKRLVSFPLSPEMEERLSYLQRATGKNRREVFVGALSVYEKFWEIKINGGSVSIQGTDGQEKEDLELP